MVKREATPAQVERLRKAREARLNGRISDSPLSEHREILAKAQDEVGGKGGYPGSGALLRRNQLPPKIAKEVPNAL